MNIASSLSLIVVFKLFHGLMEQSSRIWIVMFHHFLRILREFLINHELWWSEHVIWFVRRLEWFLPRAIVRIKLHVPHVIYLVYLEFNAFFGDWICQWRLLVLTYNLIFFNALTFTWSLIAWNWTSFTASAILVHRSELGEAAITLLITTIFSPLPLDDAELGLGGYFLPPIHDWAYASLDTFIFLVDLWCNILDSWTSLRLLLLQVAFYYILLNVKFEVKAASKHFVQSFLL